jgi:hypothetical protein
MPALDADGWHAICQANGCLSIQHNRGFNTTFFEGAFPPMIESSAGALGYQQDAYSVNSTLVAPYGIEAGQNGKAAYANSSVGAPQLSFVIPVKEEEATIGELYRRIQQEVARACTFEVIFVDDGSTDSSWAVIVRLARQMPDRVRGIRFRHHAGKAAALTAGFRAARGRVVFTMDADLQDDPAEIGRFLRKLGEGFDLVSGWKKVRHDPWHKVWPSRVFNRMLSSLGGVTLHDHNCGFKCYRAEVVRNLTLYGELHRMVPCLAAMKGYRAAEIEVRHQPRLHGRSKYGIERFLRGFFDMLTVWFLRKYGERPSHFVGTVAVAVVVLGGVLMLGAVVGGASTPGELIIGMLGAALVASSAGILVAGLISELLNRGGLSQHWELRIAEDTADTRPTAGRTALSENGRCETERTELPRQYSVGARQKGNSAGRGTPLGGPGPLSTAHTTVQKGTTRDTNDQTSAGRG